MPKEATVEEVYELLHKQLRRLQDLGPRVTVDARSELGNNVYPALLKLVQAQAAVNAEYGEAIAELVNEEESFIVPELATDIQKVIAMGSVAIVMVKEHLDAIAGGDELKKKKAAELIKDYEATAPKVLAEVDASTAVEEDEERDSDEEEEEEQDLDAALDEADAAAGDETTEEAP